MIIFVITDCKEFQKIDPFLEIQKYAFILKLGLNRSHDAIMLEYFLQKLEAFSYVELPVSSILQLLIQLKNFNIDSKPIMVGFKFLHFYKTDL